MLKHHVERGGGGRKTVGTTGDKEWRANVNEVSNNEARRCGLSWWWLLCNVEAKMGGVNCVDIKAETKYSRSCRVTR